MNRKKIVLIVGTRPEAIKMAALYRCLQKSAGLRPILVSTGQHKEMLRQALATFELTPDIDLELMQENQMLAELTARILRETASLLEHEKPQAVLVQGDTATALAASLAAFYARVHIGHVEAGLRTYDLGAPWPEEMNRRLIDPVARWCFAPTELSRDNLLSERISPENIHVTGNTVIDALLWTREHQRNATNDAIARATAAGVSPKMAQHFFSDAGKRWILITGHRRESFGEGFENICRAIVRLVEEHRDIGAIYPVHLNPNVQKPVKMLLGGHPRISLIEPLSYENFVWFMDRAYFILSDSGGVQEEAPSLGKPVLVMRRTTERPEGIAAGTSRLVGTDPESILRESRLLILDTREYETRSALRNPFGDGRAAQRITEILENSL